MKNPRKINLIVVHCSATRVNQDFPVPLPDSIWA